MKLNEVLDRNFGLTGIRKDELNQLLHRGISETLGGMAAPSESRRWVLSMSKRINGALIDNMFHIRNVVGGKEKYMHRKLMRYMAPAIQSGMKAAAIDHPEINTIDPAEFAGNFVEWIMDNIESFKQVVQVNASR